MALLTGGSATWTSAGRVLTVTGVDLTTVYANMTVHFVTSGKIDGDAYIILSVTPSGSSGGSITVTADLPTYSAAKGIVVDTMAFNGSGAALANQYWASTTNAIASMLGAGFTADASSRVMELAKATSGALGRIVFKIGSTAQFMIDQIASASVEYLKLKRTTDGTTWLDCISINKTTGEIVTTGALTINGGVNGDRAPFRNRIINGNFNINQRVVSGTVTLAAGAYGHDRWKAGASGCTYTFATSGGVTTLTISAGTLIQVIEDVNIDGTAFVMSWTGTATGRIYQGSATGPYVASPIAVTGYTAASAITVEFGTGTLSKVQFEPGAVSTAFEFRPEDLELKLCQRYFFKTFPAAVAPAQNVAAAAGCLQFFAYATTATQTCNLTLPVKMRVAPTLTTYNPYAANTGWSASGSSNYAAASYTISDQFIVMRCEVTVPANNNMLLHITASAEL